MSYSGHPFFVGIISLQGIQFAYSKDCQQGGILIRVNENFEICFLNPTFSIIGYIIIHK